MALTPILGIQQVAANQSNKEATINDAILALESAGNGSLTLDYSAQVGGDYVLGENQFSRNFLFKTKTPATGVSAIFLHLPQTVNGHTVQRIFAVKNATAAALTVFISNAAVGTTGNTGLSVPAESSRLLAMDGDDIIVAAEPTTTSRFLDLADVPGSYVGKGGLTFRVKTDETGIEFVDGITVEELSDTDMTAKADGSILRYSNSSSKWVATPLQLITTFLGLTDTPNSFAGKSSYVLHVNSSENAIEFVSPLALGGPVTGGGNTGQVLTKNTSTDGDYGWATPGQPLPTGGVSGQYLKKTGTHDGDEVWADLPAQEKELPTGGSSGQILVKASSVEGAVLWVDPDHLQVSYDSAVVNSVAVSRLNNQSFTLPWTPTVGNALVVGYFSNATLTATAGWVEMSALIADSDWTGAKVFGRVVQTGDTTTIVPCNHGTADCAVVFEIDMRYLSAGLPGLSAVMAYNDTGLPEFDFGTPTALIIGSADRAGAHPAYTVTGAALHGTVPSQDASGSDRYAGGMYIDPADAGVAIDISYSLGGGSGGVYFYIATPAIASPVEEAPTDGGRYVRSNKVWKAQGAPLPTGGFTSQILAKNSNNDWDVSWKTAPAGVPTGGTGGQVLTKNSGTSGDYAWKSVGTIPAGGSVNMVLTKHSNTDFDLQWSAAPIPVPAGGAVGKFLVKTGAGDGVTGWGDTPKEIPTGGTVGQYLAKHSLTDGDVSWISGPTGIPAGGTTGQYLVKQSSGDGDFAWSVGPSGVPPAGLTGQILTKISMTDGDVAWQTAPIALPAGGTTGQILAKASGTEGDAAWIDDPAGSVLPSLTGNAGRVLAVNVTADGTEWINASGGGGSSLPSLMFTCGHIPASSELLFGYFATSTFYIHTNFPDSLSHIGTNPAASFVITVAKNGTAFGTISVSTAGAVTFASSGTETVNSGDFLSFTAPATADTAIKNIVFMIMSDLIPPPPVVGYGRYRIDITTNNGDTHVGLNELYLYETAGVDIAVKSAASSGTATASSTFASSSPVNLFLGETPGSGGSNGWLTSGATNGWVQWQAGSAIDIRGISIAPRVGELTRAPKDFTFEYSDDGTTWHPVLTVTGETGWVDKEFRQYEIPSSGSHIYWRINVTANNGAGSYMGFASLVMGLASGEVVTSNTRNCYLTESSEYDTGYTIYKTLDRSSGYWVTSANVPASIEIDTGRVWAMDSFAFKCLEPTRMPKDFTMSGSNDDGATWTVVGTYTSQTGWSIGETRTFSI